MVSLLKDHFKGFPGPMVGPLLYKRCGARLVPLLYRDDFKFLNDSVTLICINPLEVGLHSLHCSSAAYLHCVGIPLIDIQCIGDWKSLAVLSYLITSLDRKVDIKQRVAFSLIKHLI